MDQRQLNTIERKLRRLRTQAAGTTAAPPSVLNDRPQRNIQDELNWQRTRHRNSLIWVIITLTSASFLLLAFIVVLQMMIRITISDYTGVSDTVVNILAGGVFAELVAVVAIVSRLVWADPKT